MLLIAKENKIGQLVDRGLGSDLPRRRTYYVLMRYALVVALILARAGAADADFRGLSSR